MQWALLFLGFCVLIAAIAGGEIKPDGVKAIFSTPGKRIGGGLIGLAIILFTGLLIFRESSEHHTTAPAVSISPSKTAASASTTEAQQNIAASQPCDVKNYGDRNLTFCGANVGSVTVDGK